MALAFVELIEVAAKVRVDGRRNRPGERPLDGDAKTDALDGECIYCKHADACALACRTVCVVGLCGATVWIRRI